MTKLESTSSTNVNVLSEDELQQVVGGRGYGGGRRRSWGGGYGYCNDYKRKDDGYGYGHDSEDKYDGGHEYEYKSEDCYEYKYDNRCGRRYW